MNRININIKDDISEEQAMWCSLISCQNLETGHGVCAFDKGIKVSMRKTRADNLTFTVYKEE